MGKYMSGVDDGIISKTELGERMRSIRLWRGHPVRTDFCRAAGLNQSSLASYEAGESVPSYVGLIRIADALEVTVGQLLATEVIPGLDAPEEALRDGRRDRVVESYAKSVENARVLDSVVDSLEARDDAVKAFLALRAVAGSCIIAPGSDGL